MSSLQNEIILEDLYEHYIEVGWDEDKAAELAQRKFDGEDICDLCGEEMTANCNNANCEENRRFL